jgi:hypothetical protein
MLHTRSRLQLFQPNQRSCLLPMGRLVHCEMLLNQETAAAAMRGAHVAEGMAAQAQARAEALDAARAAELRKCAALQDDLNACMNDADAKVCRSQLPCIVLGLQLLDGMQFCDAIVNVGHRPHSICTQTSYQLCD